MASDIRYLILAVTSRCNLSCSYCYLAAKGDGDDMADGVLDQALDLVDHDKPCHIQITGGEPTLVPDKISRIAQRSRLMQVKPNLAIQTNATLLTRELGQLFKKYAFQVGVSLDGPPDIQDLQRGLASETLRGLQLLETMNIPFRVTTVVTRDNVPHLAKLALLLAGFKNSRGIGLDLLVHKGRAADNGIKPPSPTELRGGITSLIATLRAVNRHRAIPLRLREQDLLTGRGGNRPFCRAAMGQSLAVSPDGSLFPCGQTMGDPLFFLGRVEKPEQKNDAGLLTTLKLQSNHCSSCPLQGSCLGDCPSRLHYNNKVGRNALACILYKTLAG